MTGRYASVGAAPTQGLAAATICCGGRRSRPVWRARSAVLTAGCLSREGECWRARSTGGPRRGSGLCLAVPRHRCKRRHTSTHKPIELAMVVGISTDRFRRLRDLGRSHSRGERHGVALASTRPVAPCRSRHLLRRTDCGWRSRRVAGGILAAGLQGRGPSGPRGRAMAEQVRVRFGPLIKKRTSTLS